MGGWEEGRMLLASVLASGPGRRQGTRAGSAAERRGIQAYVDGGSEGEAFGVPLRQTL